MAIGSIIKNSLVYVIVMGIAIFLAVNLYLFNGVVGIIQYAADTGATGALAIGEKAILDIFIGLLIIFVGLGLAINVSLPSIVSDQLVEF